ncbi:hypothetical protein ACJX0J_022373, partial [Zea mays]
NNIFTVSPISNLEIHSYFGTAIFLFLFFYLFSENNMHIIINVIYMHFHNNMFIYILCCLNFQQPDSIFFFNSFLIHLRLESIVAFFLKGYIFFSFVSEIFYAIQIATILPRGEDKTSFSHMFNNFFIILYSQMIMQKEINVYNKLNLMERYDCREIEENVHFFLSS